MAGRASKSSGDQHQLVSRYTGLADANEMANECRQPAHLRQAFWDSKVQF